MARDAGADARNSGSWPQARAPRGSAVTRVYGAISGLQTTIKDAGRFRQIATVLIRHGFGALLARLQVAEATGLHEEEEASSEPATTAQPSTAQRIRMAIEELGPTFIKLGQILSTRSDLVPADICEELQHLQDRVPPMQWEDVRAQVEAELGGKVEELFAEFSQEPLASASIAQVHRARLPDGSDVVVKVQRRGVATQVDSDLNILFFLARRAEAAVPDLALMDPVGVVGEFEKAIRLELDFVHERAHIRKFARNFADFERLQVPEVFDAHSGHAVLTMQFMEGVKITHAVRELGVDPYEVAPRMLRALFKMIFRDGYFHGDLHPGNILIRADGSIGLIDFGLVGRLSPAQRDNILDILVGIARRDYATVARVFFDLGVKLPGVIYDYDAFEADVVELIEKHIADQTLAEVDVGVFFRDLVNGAIRHQIKMPPSYTMVFKALMTCEGIGKSMAPEINLIEEAEPFIREVLTERYGPRRLLRETADTLSSASRFLRHFPDSASQLLRAAQQGRLMFRVEHEKLDRFLDEQERSNRRLIRGVLAGFCIVAASICLGAPGPQIYGLNAYAFFLFIVSALLALPTLADVLRPGGR